MINARSEDEVDLTEEDKINIKLAENVNLSSVEVTYPNVSKSNLII